MFESMIVKAMNAKEVSWDNPTNISIKSVQNDDKFNTYTLCKGAENAIYKYIDIKPATSKEIYKKSENIWRDLRDIQLKKCAEDMNTKKAFSLTKDTLIYLVDDYNNIIDIFDAYSEEGMNEFEETLSKFIIDITTMEKTKKFFADSKSGLVKLICYDKHNDPPNESYTPIIMIEANNKKSKYTVCTGILIYDTFTFIPAISYYLEADALHDFIRNLDIQEALKYSKENALDLYNSYKIFVDNPIEISARELISILKNLGYKLDLKIDNQIEAISNITDEVSNSKLQEFFNTFTTTTGETAYDILALSELQKIFRYNKLTLLEVLAILSKEYLTYEGSKITSDSLSSIVYTLFEKRNDKRQAESIKKEIKD